MMLAQSGNHVPCDISSKYKFQRILSFLYSVVLDASSISFQYYTSGIFCDSDCNQAGLNHAMLVVGYGTDSSTGLDYWILKNRFERNSFRV